MTQTPQEAHFNPVNSIHSYKRELNGPIPDYWVKTFVPTEETFDKETWIIGNLSGLWAKYIVHNRDKSGIIFAFEDPDELMMFNMLAFG